MSGHSKWSSIKHKKGAADAKRGKIFTKIVRELTVAARDGGGDPDSNPRLRLAINNAKAANMPSDNVERAIKKGTGDMDGVSYEEITYEGYGPEGVAILVKCLTDNKNRTSSEVRFIFSKRNGNMAGAGSVAFLFEPKGLITIKTSAIEEEALFEIVTEAGAEDMTKEGEVYEIITDTSSFESVKKAIADNAIEVENSELTMIPKTTTTVDVDKAKSILGLIEALEDHDDVQNVYANLDIPEELLE